jgi:hypothetical protein
MPVTIATTSKALLAAAVIAAVAFPVSSFAQGVRIELGAGDFRFEEGDHRANEGKRASCELYAQLSVVQAEANRRHNCGFGGPRWDTSGRTHFHWCRYVAREAVRQELRGRGQDLQQCFDRMGDFDEERQDWRRERY